MNYGKALVYFFASHMLALGLVACTGGTSVQVDKSSGPTEVPGTGDGGGGVVRGSTKEEVRAAIYATREKLTSPFLFEFIYNEVPLALDYENFEEESELTKQWMAKILDSELPEEDLISVYLIPNNLDNYVDDIPLNILEAGACEAPDKEHPDASVDQFNRKASICFSLENLMRIPRSVLHIHIAGLWFHELAHMNGYDETVAVRVQEVIEFAYPYLAANDKFNPKGGEFYNALHRYVGSYSFALFEAAEITSLQLWDADKVPKNVNKVMRETFIYRADIGGARMDVMRDWVESDSAINWCGPGEDKLSQVMSGALKSIEVLLSGSSELYESKKIDFQDFTTYNLAAHYLGDLLNRSACIRKKPLVCEASMEFYDYFSREFQHLTFDTMEVFSPVMFEEYALAHRVKGQQVEVGSLSYYFSHAVGLLIRMNELKAELESYLPNCSSENEKGFILDRLVQLEKAKNKYEKLFEQSNILSAINVEIATEAYIEFINSVYGRVVLKINADLGKVMMHSMSDSTKVSFEKQDFKILRLELIEVAKLIDEAAFISKEEYKAIPNKGDEADAHGEGKL